MVRQACKERAAAYLAAGVALAFFAATLEAAAWKLPWVKPRIIVETDAPGGDPDDEGSLVRFFLYLNEWDVEAIIATRAAAQSRLGISGKQRILQYVDDYATVYPNLRVHATGFPEPEQIRRRVFSCAEGIEARDAVLAILDRDDPRPVWYLNWGTNEEDNVPTALRQALDLAQARRTPAEYRRLTSQLRYTEVYWQDHLGPHRNALTFFMETFFPVMDGGRWYHRWAPLTKDAGGFDVERDIKSNHGALTANYTIVKEGDTPTFMHLIPNGLGDPHRPQWGGWSGRYGFNAELNAWWCDQRDTWSGSTSRDNTLARWAAHIQNDFRARAEWCIRARKSEANHAPVPVLQGDDSWDVLFLDVPAGKPVDLLAKGSSDPDGESLRFEWIHYREAGSYDGAIAIEAEGVNARMEIPVEAKGQTIHIVLQVTDSGSPPLTRYRRAILNAR
jgi:hypothetical protein